MRPEQFAKAYGLHEQTVRKWCRTGKLVAKQINRSWIIDVEKSLKP